MFYAGPTQINFQTPYDTPLGTATVIITAAGGASEAVSVDVVAAAPGIFTIPNTTRAAALNEDYSVNGPDNPASSGKAVMLFLTGLGDPETPPASGVPAPLDRIVPLSGATSVTVGGKPATVLFVGLAPGFVGLEQVNILLPDLPSGPHEAIVTRGSAKTNTATLIVR